MEGLDAYKAGISLDLIEVLVHAKSVAIQSCHPVQEERGGRKRKKKKNGEQEEKKEGKRRR